MPHSFSTRRTLPFQDSLTGRDREVAERALTRQEQRRRRSNDSRGQSADELADSIHRRVRNLVGAKSFLALRDDLMRERLSFRDLWEPPEGVKRNYGKQRAAAKRRGDAILRKHGMSREKLRKIGRDADAKLNALLALDDASIVSGYNLKNNLSRWTKLSRLNTLPLPWINDLPEPDPTDPNRWFLFRPPFFGFLFSDDYVTSTNFDAGSMLHLHPPSGLVGVEASMDCNDASSFDFASVAVESQIAVAFDPPKAGVIEVLIDAQCTVGTHSVKIKDEFGFSSGWCNQNNYLMMNVLHPNVPEASLALMSNLFEETDGDDLSENRENLTRGQHYFAQLFSSGPVPAGQRVFVTAGTRTFDKARANDMTVESRTNLQWFISSLQVRISP